MRGRPDRLAFSRCSTTKLLLMRSARATNGAEWSRRGVPRASRYCRQLVCGEKGWGGGCRGTPRWGRVLEGRGTMGSCSGWVGRVLEGRGTMGSHSGWVGRVLEGHGTMGSYNDWTGRILEGRETMRFYRGWVGRVLEGHGTMGSHKDWVGRVLEDHTTVGSYNDWTGRILEGRGTMRSYSGWVGRVLEGHRTMGSYSSWDGRVLEDHTTVGSYKVWVGRVPEGHGTMGSHSGWGWKGPGRSHVHGIPHTHLPHHVCGRLPAPRADVFVAGDVEVRGRLVVLNHVKQSRGALQCGTGGKEHENGAGRWKSEIGTAKMGQEGGNRRLERPKWGRKVENGG